MQLANCKSLGLGSLAYLTDLMYMGLWINAPMCTHYSCKNRIRIFAQAVLLEDGLINDRVTAHWGEGVFLVPILPIG